MAGSSADAVPPEVAVTFPSRVSSRMTASTPIARNSLMTSGIYQACSMLRRTMMRLRPIATRPR